jgi:Uma2 family endonuclease
MSDDEFFAFCQRNGDWRLERSASGDLIIMPPTGGHSGRRNFSLIVQFGQWSKADGTGIGFDSSTGFHLPNGADRSPDVSWVRRERWDALTEKERDEFPPIAPDFVVELRSKSDSIEDLDAKMREYVENGVGLGWLLDPSTRTVYVYRPNRERETLHDPGRMSGAPELPGFVLDLADVW